MSAAANGNLSILNWLKDRSCEVHPRVALLAAQRGHYDAFRLVIETYGLAVLPFPMAKRVLKQLINDGANELFQWTVQTLRQMSHTPIYQLILIRSSGENVI